MAKVSGPVSMYKDVRSRVRIGDGFSEELDVVLDVHQGSVLSRLLLIIVLEAPSREFHTGSCCVQVTRLAAGKVEDMEIRDGG